MRTDIVKRAVCAGLIGIASYFTTGCTIQPTPPQVITKTVVKTQLVCPKPLVYTDGFYDKLGVDLRAMGDSFPTASQFMRDYVHERDELKACVAST